MISGFHPGDRVLTPSGKEGVVLAVATNPVPVAQVTAAGDVRTFRQAALRLVEKAR